MSKNQKRLIEAAEDATERFFMAQKKLCCGQIDVALAHAADAEDEMADAGLDLSTGDRITRGHKALVAVTKAYAEWKQDLRLHERREDAKRIR